MVHVLLRCPSSWHALQAGFQCAVEYLEAYSCAVFWGKPKLCCCPFRVLVLMSSDDIKLLQVVDDERAVDVFFCPLQCLCPLRLKGQHNTLKTLEVLTR